MLNTLTFKTPGMAAVWLGEIRNQFSDGYYEFDEAWMDDEKSRIIEEFQHANVEVAGEDWKSGLDMGKGYRESCPLSGVKALESILSELKYHRVWPYCMAFYYAFGEKYGIEKLKELQKLCVLEVAEDMVFDAWFWQGMPSYSKSHWYQQRKDELKDRINLEELLEYFENLDRDATIEKLRKNIDEIDMVLGYNACN